MLRGGDLWAQVCTRGVAFGAFGPGLLGPKGNGRKRVLPAAAVTAFATQGVVTTARVSVLVSV